MTGLLACLLFVLVPSGAAGVPGVPAAQAPLAASGACVSTPSSPSQAALAEPPCGYIQPFVNIDIDGKKPCKKADHTDCAPLPALGQTVTFKGRFQYYWKLSEDLTYPATDPIQVSFGGVASNPKWLTFSVEPKSLAIQPTDLVSPAYIKVDQSGPSPVVYYWYEQPITITVKHASDPSQAELDRVAAKDGTAILLVKAKTSASGAYYKEGFGTEDFRFDATSLLSTTGEGGTVVPVLDDAGHAVPAGSAPAKPSPATGLLAAVGALAAVAALVRRRDD
jgi:hypothetical protein